MKSFTKACLSVAVMGTALTGCASIVGSSSQTINIDSAPKGAQCQLIREGKILSQTTTPGSVHIGKSTNDITVECTKPGYEKSRSSLKSGTDGWVIGNIFLGGPIGLCIDWATGALNEYPDNSVVAMQKDYSTTNPVR